MDITFEELNALNYEQSICFHISLCGFVSQHQSELVESGLSNDSGINTYKSNVQNMIPDSFGSAVFLESNSIVWNMVLKATENLARHQDVNFSKEFVNTVVCSWKNAMVDSRQ